MFLGECGLKELGQVAGLGWPLHVHILCTSLREPTLRLYLNCFLWDDAVNSIQSYKSLISSRSFLLLVFNWRHSSVKGMQLQCVRLLYRLGGGSYLLKEEWGVWSALWNHKAFSVMLTASATVVAYDEIDKAGRFHPAFFSFCSLGFQSREPVECFSACVISNSIPGASQEL